MPKDDETLVDQEIAVSNQANDTLEEDNRRFRHLLSNAPSVTYSFEAKGDFRPTYISENVTKVFGYEPHEYLTDNKFAGRRVHPDDAKRVKGELSRLFELGHLIIEYRFLCKDDSYCWVSDEMRLIHDEEGQPLEVVGSWHDITVQRQINEELNKIKNRLGHILGSSPVVVYSFEGKGNFSPTFISENLKEVFGYEQREYLEDPKFMPSRIHPEDHARIDKMWSQLFRKGNHVNEYRFRRNDGKYRWVRDELRLLRDKDGEPLEVIGAMNDITERKKEEEEMLRLKNRLNHLLTSSPSVTYCFEAKGDYLPTFVGENIKDLLGYEPEEYLKDRNFVPSHIHPDDAQRAQDDLSRLFEEGYLVHEYRFLCKDGHYCWVNDELHVLTDDYGEPLEVVGAWSDITVRRKMGEAMVAAQDRLNHLLTSAPAVIYSFEKTGEYAPTFISENVKSLLGYEPKEFLKNADFWTDRIHPNDLPRVQENLKRLYEDGQLTQEYRLLHKEGHYCWVNDELHLQRNKDDDPTEIVGSMNDITERKKIEEELALAKEQAEKLILNILPISIANRLKDDEKIIADKYAEATVLFLDIVGFTEFSSKLLPSKLVSVLNDIFTRFDLITEKYNLEKIKTIGDSYLLVGGLPDERDDHAEAVAFAAIEMRDEIKKFNQETGENINVRIGIHSGPVVAGVIGKNKFSYDIWGDTVNIASRLESHSEPGKIQVSEITYYLIKDKFKLEERGLVELKGKGEFKTYYLIDL